MFSAWRPSGASATPFYQMTLRLDPVWLAAALTVPRFLDAFIDPIVGVSPTTSTRASAGGARSSRSAPSSRPRLRHDLDGAAELGTDPAHRLARRHPDRLLRRLLILLVPFLALQYEITRLR